MDNAVISLPEKVKEKYTKVMSDAEKIEISKLIEQMEVFLARFAEMEKVHQVLREKVDSLTRDLAVRNEEMKLKVQELEAVKDNLNYSLQGVTAGILAVNKDGIITTINKSAEGMLGISAEEFLGKKIDDVFNNDHKVLVENLYKAMSGKTQIDNVEVSFGESLYMLGVSFILDENNEILGAVETFRDLTEVRKLEQHLDRKNRLADLGEMAAGVAHEIRNPLGGIDLYVSLLARDLKDQPEQAELANKVLKGVNTMNKIVENMLAFTRDVVPEKKSVKISSVVDEALGLLQPQIQEKQTTIIRNYNFNNEIQVDPSLMVRAIMNLILNGVQIMDAAGEMTINLDSKSGETGIFVELCFKDNGPGLSDEDIEKVFNPFYTRRDKGTGLGLAIVHRIVESHGGEVIASNAPEGGAIFTVRLPLKEGTTQDEA